MNMLRDLIDMVIYDITTLIIDLDDCSLAIPVGFVGIVVYVYGLTAI